MTKVNRRDFLKGAVGAGIVFGGITLNVISENDLTTYDKEEEANRPYAAYNDPDKSWMMVIDLEACDGCVNYDTPQCTKACQDGHFTPVDQEFIRVFKIESDEYTKEHYFPRPCQQCLNPPCVKACPVGAAWQRDGDRLTLIDQTRCIGCRVCMTACPYEVRFFNFEKNPRADEIPDSQYEAQMPFALNKRVGVISKCEFCGLQYEGKLTHCTTACPQGAIYFGDKNENMVTNAKGVTEIADEFLKRRSAFRWKEEEGTEPRVFYLPPVEDS